MTKVVSYFDRSGKPCRTKCSTDSARVLGRLSGIEAVKLVDFKTYQKWKPLDPQLTAYKMQNEHFFIFIESGEKSDFLLLPDEDYAISVLSNYLLPSGSKTAQKICERKFQLNAKSACFVSAFAKKHNVPENEALDYIIFRFIDKFNNGDDLSNVSEK